MCLFESHNLWGRNKDVVSTGGCDVSYQIGKKVFDIIYIYILGIEFFLII